MCKMLNIYIFNIFDFSYNFDSISVILNWNLSIKNELIDKNLCNQVENHSS